jgi:hypothetical protein
MTMSDYVKFVGLLDAGPKDYENPPCEFCGTTHHEEQHALLAFGVNGYSAILQATPAVICDMREAGISPVDIWGVSPGLYEWHGYIRYRSNGEGYDPDVDYDGDIIRISADSEARASAATGSVPSTARVAPQA